MLHPVAILEWRKRNFFVTVVATWKCMVSISKQILHTISIDILTYNKGHPK